MNFMDVVLAVLEKYRPLIDCAETEGHRLLHETLFPITDYRQVMIVIKEVIPRFQEQQILLEIPYGIKIIGDLHGNLKDLLRLFWLLGPPWNTKYLFLGDYVDRGAHSVEVILLLFSLTILYPDNIFLLRGNHEFGSVNMQYGFFKQIMDESGSEVVWDRFQDAFAWMPLAAIVGGEIFCVHGGLSPSMTSLDDIRKMKRPLYECDTRILSDIMWSDPIDTTSGYVKSFRGPGVMYGPSITRKFLSQNNFKLVIRAHQCVADGLDIRHEGLSWTVFSSSGYNPPVINHCGVIELSEDGSQKAYKLEDSRCTPKAKNYSVQSSPESKMRRKIVQKKRVTTSLPVILPLPDF